MRLFVNGNGDEFIVETVKEERSRGFFCVNNEDYRAPGAGSRLATRWEPYAD